MSMNDAILAWTRKGIRKRKDEKNANKKERKKGEGKKRV